MRRVLLASLSLIAFAAPAYAARALDDNGYLPPPAPVDYQRTLQVVGQMPAFKAQADAGNNASYINAYAAPAAAPQPVQMATNYQVAAIPDYLPMSRIAAQNPGTMATMYGGNAYGGAVQQVGFVTQNSAQGTLTGQQAYSAPAQASASASASPAPLLSAEPVQPQPAPQYVQPAPQSYEQQPQAYSAPVPQAMYPQQAYATQVAPQPYAQAYAPQYVQQAAPVEPAQMATQAPPVMPVAPAPQAQAYYPMASQPSMVYNPPTMDGNPRYDAIDAPTKPSMAYDPAWRDMGWYGGARVSLNLPEDTSFSTAAGKYTNENHTGYGIGAFAGYAFRPFTDWVAPRLEGEFSRQYQTVNKHSIGATSFTDPNAYGTTTALVGLANGYLDFGLSRIVQPYLTAGIGFGVVDFDRHGVTTPIMDDSAFGFAWQGGAGVGIHLGPGSILDIGYRYLQVPTVDLKARDGTTSSTDLSEHQFMLDLRQSF